MMSCFICKLVLDKPEKRVMHHPLPYIHAITASQAEISATLRKQKTFFLYMMHSTVKTI